MTRNYFFLLLFVLIQTTCSNGFTVEPEFLINSHTTDEQRTPAVATDGSNYFAMWESMNQDGDDGGIYGKIVSSAGVDLTSEISINTDVTADQQSNPDIAFNGSRYMVVWESEGEDNDGKAIIGTILDNDGNQSIAPFLINTATTNSQIDPTITTMGSRFIVVWSDNSSGTSYEIKRSAWNISGISVAPEFQISTILSISMPSDHFNPVICANTYKYAVAWKLSGTTSSIFMNLFHDNDSPVFSTEKKVSISLLDDEQPALATDGSQFLVVWTNAIEDGDGQGIFGRLVDNDGAFGTAFQINTYTTGNQFNPCVEFNGTAFLVSWTSALQDNDGNGVYGQLIATDGSLIGEEFRINTHPSGDQMSPACSSIGPDYFVFWEGSSNNTDNHGIYATQLENPFADTDNDQLVNHAEWTQQTDHTNPDTDNDMLTDGSEVLEYNTDPLDNDSDDDSLMDGEEVFINPGETLVNEYTTNGQSNVTAVSSNYGYMLAWLSITPEDSLGIYGRILDNDGLPTGSDIHINTYTTGLQDTPAISSNGTNYLIAWQSLSQDNDGFGIFAQIIDNEGQKVGAEFLVNASTASDQNNPAIASNGTEYLALWQSFNQAGNDSYDIYGRIIDNDGTFVSSELHINTYTTSEQRNPAVAFNGEKYLVAWESRDQDNDTFGVFAQILDNDGQKEGAEIQVNTYTTSEQFEPAVTSDGTNFLIVWSSLQQTPDANSYGVFAQLIGVDGSLIGSELSINTYTTSSQRLASVTHNGHDYFIVWESFGQDGSNKGIFGQRIANDLTFIGSEFKINNFTTGTQASPAITSQDTSYLVAFHGTGNQNSSDIFATRFKWAAGTDPLDNDTDDDLKFDGDEITAGTNPLDASSLFDIFFLDVPHQTVDVSFSWFSIPGKKYAVQADSSNNTAGFLILEDNYTSQGFITTYMDSGGGPQALTHPSFELKSRLYKVIIRD